jgi:hypothetical protein
MVATARIISLLQPDVIPFDQEELYNAAHARLIQLEHPGRWLDLQYRGYCGGCTQHALLGALLFSFFGHSLFVWKLIPVMFSALMAYAGAHFLARAVNNPSAVIFGLLLAFPPPTFAALSMTAWGNHAESGVAAILILALVSHLLLKPATGSALALGLGTGWALWIGFSSVFIPLALGVILWRKITRFHALLVGVAAGSVGLIWIFQYQTAPSGPFETIYYAGESFPSLARIPRKIWSLMAPRQLIALFGISSNTIGQTLGILTAISIPIAGMSLRRHKAMRSVWIFIAGFGLVYSTVRFTVWTPSAPDFASAGSLRYAAPIFGLLFIVLAAGAGHLWAKALHIRAIVLLAPTLITGIWHTSQQFRAPFPDFSVLTMAAPDFEYARDQAGYILGPTEHRDCASTDPQIARFHAYADGWHEARQFLDNDPLAMMVQPTNPHPAALEGVGAALIAEVDPNENMGPRSLDHMLAQLQGMTPNEQVIVLTSAAALRPWLDTLTHPHNPSRMTAFSALIQGQDKIIQRARSRRFGHQWGSEISRHRKPKSVQIQGLTHLTHPDEFIYGLGVALGERWGEATETGLVTGIPERLSSQWTAGTNAGIERRWIKQLD